MTRHSAIARLSLLAPALAIVGGLLAFGGAALSAQGAAVTVRDAWVREVPSNRKDTAVFAVVENKTAAKRAIVGVATDAAEKAELHEMKMSGSMMKMSPVKSINLPANGKADLKPGGFHIMLFNLKTPPMVGDTVNLTLTLDDGTTVAVAAQVRKQEGMK